VASLTYYYNNSIRLSFVSWFKTDLLQCLH